MTHSANSSRPRRRTAVLWLLALTIGLPLSASAQQRVDTEQFRYAQVYGMKLELQRDLRERLQELLGRIAAPREVTVAVEVAMSGALREVVNKETDPGMEMNLQTGEAFKLPGLPTVKAAKQGAPKVHITVPPKSKVQVKQELDALVERILVRIYLEEGAGEELVERIKEATTREAGLDLDRGDVIEVIETPSSGFQEAGMLGLPSDILSTLVWCLTLLVCSALIARGLGKRGSGTSTTTVVGEGLGPRGGGEAGAEIIEVDDLPDDEEVGADDGRPKAFASLRKLKGEELFETLLELQPRTAVAVFDKVQLDPETVRRYFDTLPPARKMETVQALAKTEVIPVTELEQMEAEAEAGLAKVRSRTKIGSTDKAADLLAIASHDDARALLGELMQQDPALAGRIREGMALFEDLPSLPVEQVREIITALDPSVTVVALQGAEAEIRNAAFGAVSKRLQAILKSEEETTKEKTPEEVEAARYEFERVMREVRTGRRPAARPAAEA